MKHPFKTKYILYIFLMTISISYYSQNQPTKVASIESLTYLQQPTFNQNGDTLYKIKFAINLVDSINLDKINVKIGSTYNGNDIFEGNFNFYSNQTSDTTFTRNQLRIVGDVGGAGEYSPGIYFYKVTVEDFQGLQYPSYIKQQ